MNKEGNEIRYLKEISKKFNTENNYSITRKNSRSCCHEKPNPNEKYFWIPKETFEFAHKFKESLQGQLLTNDLIENLLFEVDLILEILF